MNFRQTILSVISLSLLATLVACGGGSSNTTTPPATISVAMGTPPASMAESTWQNFTATVSNDSTSGGVNWSVACGSANCGSFSSTSTPSGTATVYTAPSTIPTGGTVTVTASSVTDGTKKSNSSVSITVASSLADGTYVFSLTGKDFATAGLDYSVAGAFTVASGAITGGEQDFVDFDTPTVNDAITGGSVSTKADGNLQIVINTADVAIGVGGVETFNGTLVSGTRGLITEFDLSATSSGTLDLQTGAAAPSGSYAFFVNGGDVISSCATATSGVINVGAGGAVSSTGSVVDYDDCGTPVLGQPVDAGTVSAPDSLGRVTISLNLTTSGIGGLGAAGYIVDADHIRLIENNQDTNDIQQGATSGTALAQGASAGTFNTASVAGTTYAFGTNGEDFAGYAQMAAALTLNAGGTVTGTLDYNDLACACTQTSLSVSGAYTVDSTGRVTISNLIDAAATLPAPLNVQLYLDGNGNGIVTTVDMWNVVGGLAYQQVGTGSFSAASFSGSYAFNTTGTGIVLYSEFDTVGPVTADGVSAMSGTFDQNVLNGNLTAGLTLTDGFTADPSGVFIGTITGLDNSSTTAQDLFRYYVVDSTKAFAIETDLNQLTLGYFELQQ